MSTEISNPNGASLNATSPLRPIFFGLLLANVAFFAWVQQAPPQGEHEPARMQAQIDADKLKVISPQEQASALLSPQPETPVATPVVAVSEACRTYTGIAAGVARTLQAEMMKEAPQLKVVLPHGKDASFWVFIPPLANKAAAEKKVGELKQLGVEDSFIMQDDDAQRFSISLGLFRSEELATAYLSALNKKGVRSARMAPRERGDKADEEKIAIEISGDPVVITRLEREHKALAGIAGLDCKRP